MITKLGMQGNITWSYWNQRELKGWIKYDTYLFRSPQDSTYQTIQCSKRPLKENKLYVLITCIPS